MTKKKRKNKATNKMLAWVLQLENALNGEAVFCPFCGNQVTSKFYAFDDSDRGYGEFECEKCGETYHLCRLMYPENIKIFPERISSSGKNPAK